MSEGGTPANPTLLTGSTAPGASTGGAADLEKPPSMVLATACLDTTRVVAAAAGFLAINNCLK